MHEDYRDAKVKELRDQLTRFAPKVKKIEQAEREFSDRTDHAGRWRGGNAAEG